jgi:probable HAF family extracellular repeat protein
MLYSHYPLVFCLFGLAAFNAEAGPPVYYTVTDLGTLGGNYSAGHGINASGQVVGFSFPPDNVYFNAFLYSNGKMQNLGTFGTFSYGYAINDSGQVAGSSQTNGGQEHAFLYSNGHLQDLGTFGGHYSYGFDINASGQVVGTAGISENPRHAFLI